MAIARKDVPVWPRAVAVVLLVIAVAVLRNYFFGKKLDADDLTHEQEYQRCRRRPRH